MQNLQDIQEKIFFEAKNILETLSKINSKDELLAKQDLFSEVTDRIAFLRILEKNRDSFVVETPLQIIDNQETDLNLNKEHAPKNEEYFDDAPYEEDVIEEEVIFTNELNDIDAEELPEISISGEELEAPIVAKLSEGEVSDLSLQEPDKEIPLIVEQEQSDYHEKVAQREREFLESEERRRKIVEFNKEDVVHPPKEEVFQENKTQQHHAEKKFKLANIKGLKAVQNLFDDDPLENAEDVSVKHAVKDDSGSLLKTNIPTDFMEAEKRKPEFRLDLNDKVAFTKLLFKGNEEELKFTIDKLNSFKDLEDARQYLSEIYYLKDWGKSDEYAQRLWSLVENKFL